MHTICLPQARVSVLKTSRPADEFGTVYMKRVATAKTRTEAVVRNAPLAACRGPCSAGLLLAPSLLLLLCRPSLLLVLLWLLLLFALSLRVDGSDSSGKQEHTCCS